ncbi:MAG: NUDIX domain-containing protein [Patescibacteria group bacterium]
MEPLIKKNWEGAVFIPYRYANSGVEFYLQKRDKNAPTHANMFSMFGGRMDVGEDVSAALRREVFEELNYAPHKPVYFGRFETARAIFHVFVEEVGNSFESLVKVAEGEYGAFLPFERIDNAKDVSDIAQMITRTMRGHFSE